MCAAFALSGKFDLRWSQFQTVHKKPNLRQHEISVMSLLTIRSCKHVKSTKTLRCNEISSPRSIILWSQNIFHIHCMNWITNVRVVFSGRFQLDSVQCSYYGSMWRITFSLHRNVSIVSLQLELQCLFAGLEQRTTKKHSFVLNLTDF